MKAKTKWNKVLSQILPTENNPQTTTCRRGLWSPGVQYCLQSCVKDWCHETLCTNLCEQQYLTPQNVNMLLICDFTMSYLVVRVHAALAFSTKGLCVGMCRFRVSVRSTFKILVQETARVVQCTDSDQAISVSFCLSSWISPVVCLPGRQQSILHWDRSLLSRQQP